MAARGGLDVAKKEKGIVQKKIGEFMKKKETPPAELMEEKKAAGKETAKKREKLMAQLHSKEKITMQITANIELREARVGSVEFCDSEAAVLGRIAFGSWNLACRLRNWTCFT